MACITTEMTEVTFAGSSVDKSLRRLLNWAHVTKDEGGGKVQEKMGRE